MRARSSSSAHEEQWGGRAAACVLLLLALVGVRTVRADGTERDKKPVLHASLAWNDRAVLARRLSEACDAVERICGAKFGKRPTVHVSDLEGMAKVLEAEFRETKALAGQAHATLARDLAQLLLAKFDGQADVILLMPRNAERLMALQGETVGPDEEVLRVLLAHEVTHALDWERFDLEKTIQGRTTSDGVLAANAVAEGHAQWVAEQAARAWGLTAAFERMTRIIVKPPAGLSPQVREALAPALAQATFAYVHGHEFMESVSKAKGREGIEAALRAPPVGTRDIEEPQRWLAGASAAPATAEHDPDLAAVLADLRVIVGDATWTVVTNRLLAAVLRTQVGKLLPEDRERYLEGYEDGQVLVGQVEGEHVMVIGMALSFHEPAQAALLIGMERRSLVAEAGLAPGLEILSTDMSDGAGPDGKLEGFAMRRVARSGDQTVVVQTQGAVAGRVAIELLVVGLPQFDRAVQDPIVARAALRATDPDAAEKAPALEPPAFRRTTTRALTVTIVDPDGKPVPRVHLSAESDKHTGAYDVPVQDGRRELLLDPYPNYRLTVWGAADAGGKALPFAPRSLVLVADDAREIELRLEPGVEIHGTVVDGDGKPVVGTTVEALATLANDGRTIYTNDVYASGNTDASGAFRLIGLENAEYRLRLMRGKKFASIGETKTQGGARDLRVVVRPPREFRLTVEDADGKPVGGAEVSVSQFGNGGASPQETTDAGGRVRLEGLDPETQATLKVKPPKDRPTLGRLRRTEWKPTDERLRLPRGYVIRGKVVDAQGEPTRARVVSEQDAGALEGVDTDKAGAFTIPHVPSGPTRIAAVDALEEYDSDSNDWDQRPEWTEVRPDQAEVTLRIQPRRKRTDPIRARNQGETPEVEEAEVVHKDRVIRDAPLDADPVAVTIRVPGARVARIGALRPAGETKAGNGEDATSPVTTFSVTEDGVVQVGPLVPGHYEVWVPTVADDDRCAYLADVELGAAPLEITLVPSVRTRFRVTLPAENSVDAVELVGPAGARFRAARGSDGTYEARGLPPGRWHGRLRARTASTWYAIAFEGGSELVPDLRPAQEIR